MIFPCQFGIQNKPLVFYVIHKGGGGGWWVRVASIFFFSERRENTITLHNNQKISEKRVRNSDSIFKAENDTVDRFSRPRHISEYWTIENLRFSICYVQIQIMSGGD